MNKKKAQAMARRAVLGAIWGEILNPTALTENDVDVLIAMDEIFDSLSSRWRKSIESLADEQAARDE